MDISLFIMHKTERTMTDAAARVELHAKRVLRIEVVSQPCMIFNFFRKPRLDIVASTPPLIISSAWYAARLKSGVNVNTLEA